MREYNYHMLICIIHGDIIFSYDMNVALATCKTCHQANFWDNPRFQVVFNLRRHDL